MKEELGIENRQLHENIFHLSNQNFKIEVKTDEQRMRISIVLARNLVTAVFSREVTVIRWGFIIRSGIIQGGADAKIIS